ncbi:hypothetical protein [Nonomuraea sp. SYSU D8015]|uniref:hypothetical protein n=1 Tax=Nonomuraea sp. SYSU D8015 TaxID=2593644 RepID=UPI00166113E2|nr:hypothetical protein [Nonomuraea sp. SYSU D8015]
MSDIDDRSVPEPLTRGPSSASSCAAALDAISTALRLSDAEHEHLTHLIRCRHRKRQASPPHREQARGTLRDMLAAMEGVPAYVTGGRRGRRAAVVRGLPSGRLVGELTLSFEAFRLGWPDDSEQCLTVYHVRPGSAAAENLRLPASWGADDGDQEHSRMMRANSSGRMGGSGSG